jgi:hypothetical protein
LIPRCFPCTPFANCANTFADCVNTFIVCIDTFVDCADKFVDYAHTSDECINTFVDLTYALDTLTLDFCILNSSHLQLSFNDWFII